MSNSTTQKIRCSLCKSYVFKNQSAAVLSFPINTINNNGEYPLIPDFIDNERIVHYSCLIKAFPNIQTLIYESNEKMPQITDHMPIVYNLSNTLSTMGDKVDINELEQFVLNHHGKNYDELVMLWFSSRNIFGR